MGQAALAVPMVVGVAWRGGVEHVLLHLLGVQRLGKTERIAIQRLPPLPTNLDWRALRL